MSEVLNLSAASAAPPSTQTIQFLPTHSGAYDEFGQHYSGQDAYSVSFSEGPGGAVPAMVAYATFDAPKIESQVTAFEAAGDAVTLTLTYQVSDAYGIAHEITVNDGYLYHTGYQSLVEADKTNNTGPGVGESAYVFDDLRQQGYEQVLGSRNIDFSGAKNVPLMYVTDISADVATSAGYMGGRDLLLTLNEPQDGGEGTGLFNDYSGGIQDYLINPQIVLTATSLGPPPVISGTVAGQRVTAGSADTPFASVTLADLGNPVGTGDQVLITILDLGGNATDAFGYLTDAAGTRLTEFATGTYLLDSAGTVQQLQQFLDSLRFQSLSTAGGQTAVLEINLQSISGRTADDTGTSVGIACFAAGTLILADGGERTVEALAIGDTIVTASGKRRPIKWIGRRSYRGRFLAANPDVQPVRLAAGCLGESMPRRDLLVSPEHAMFLDGLLIPARHLVNGSTITRERGLAQVDYFHIELESHDILLAEGAPSESFLDDDSRMVFHNAREYEALYPNDQLNCGFRAARVESGYELEAIRVRLALVTKQVVLAA